MLTITPRYRIDEEERARERADKEVSKRLLGKLDLLQIQLNDMRRCAEAVEKIANDSNNMENFKKRLLVLMECCVNSGEYFKWRLYKLYTLKIKSVDDQLMIQQCERYLENKYNEWKWLHSTYMKLIAADHSPCELTMKQFWR